MNSKIIPISIGLVLALGTGTLVYSTKEAVVLPPDNTVSVTPRGITLAQVSLHSSRMDCWSAINGSVYNLTSWIPNHPGGEQNILSLCGIDGSAKYNSKHRDSSKTALILSGFKLGVQ